MEGKGSHRRNRILKILLLVVVLIVALRLALPYVILKYANKSLATLDGYRGHIEDIDLAILRGAYKIDSIYIHKYDSASQNETPFFAASLIDLSVEWKSLFKGSVVGELIFHDPMLRFTKDKVEPQEVKKDSTDFKKVLDDLMPLKINRFEVINGSIQYLDESSKPRVDVALLNTHILALNLRNAYDSGNVLPASVSANAEMYDGTLDFNMELNPLAEVPTFDMNMEVKNTNLVKLNDFFKAYAKVDVNKGTFGLYTEVAAKEGKFTGYVKPLLQDLDVLGAEDRRDNVLKKLWEGLAGSVAEVFENQEKDQVATKIPFEGNIRDPNANIWYAIVNILQNAFIRAIQPAIDHEINLKAVDNAEQEKETFLEKVFGGDKEKKEERKERKDEEKEKKKRDK